MQLYRQIKTDITSQLIAYGSRLPSKRIMAEETGVSVITVEHAYDILFDEGYIEARLRSGYYVIYREKDYFSVHDSEQMEMPGVSVKSYSEEAFPFSSYARILRKVLTEYGEAITERSDRTGSPVFREAIARYLARSRGIRVSAEQIVIGAGSEYLYGLLIQMLGRNRIFGVESPSFDKISQIYRAGGVRIDWLKLGPDGVMTQELERTPASVLHVTPYHSYPSGITATAAKRREYVLWAKRQNAYIIEDDYDSEFSSLAKSEDTLFSLDDGNHVIYVNTFSRTMFAGIRMAYLVLPEDLIPLFRQKTGFYACTVPLLQQYAMAEILQSGHFERHVNRVRRLRRKRKMDAGSAETEYNKENRSKEENHMNLEQLDRMKNGLGFIAALDQSGGSTPKALKAYGVDETAYHDEAEMFEMVHEMRTRIIKSPSFTKEHILAAILFERTMESKIEDKFTADYLWDVKGIVPILKVDKGLAAEEDGVQLMKPMPTLDETLEKAKKYHIFGTKMRSVIKQANPKGIEMIAAQQFEIGRKIAEAGFVPIIEPEVDIHCPEKEKAEELLKIELKKQLALLPEGMKIMFKLTIPSVADFYKELMEDEHVVRVVALSGGYSQQESNEMLMKNHGLIASFSRALAQDLRYQQTEEEFNATLKTAVEAIYAASII